MISSKYKSKLWKHYGKDFLDAGEVFDPIAAKKWSKAYRWYLRGWLPDRKDGAIVELGCGSGKLLHFLKRRGYTNLQGVDISPDQVHLAQQVIPTVTQANVLDWLVGRSEQFDFIIALDLIEHFYREEALRFLELCFNSLKPKGRLVLQTPNADSPFGLQIFYGDITHEWVYNVNQLSRLLKRAGFVEIEPREQGPVPWGYSLASTLRWFMWKFIRAGLQTWNIVETGSTLPVLTRVFLIKGEKPK